MARRSKIYGGSSVIKKIKLFLLFIAVFGGVLALILGTLISNTSFKTGSKAEEPPSSYELSGNSAVFKGGYIKVPVTGITLPDTFTIETWVNFEPITTQTDYRTVLDFEKQYSNGSPFALALRKSNSLGGAYTFAFSAYGSDYLTYPVGVTGAYGTGPLKPNTWYHIAAVRDGSTLKMFLNGIEESHTSINTPLYSTTRPMWVGNTKVGNTIQNPFKGKLDELRISSVARYKNNFTAPQQPFSTDGDTLALWHFNESSGQTYVTDASGKMPNGEIVSVVDFEKSTVYPPLPPPCFVSMWGPTNNSQWGYPLGITTDKDGNIFVADTNNHRVQKFDANGNNLVTWGSKGNSDGQFNYTYGIVADPDGYVYVADGDGANTGRVQKFTNNGVFVAKYGMLGTADGQFIKPFGIARDQQGNFYVTDVSLDRVQKFDKDFNYIKQWKPTSPKGSSSRFSAITSVGNRVYISDTANNKIHIYDLEGNAISSFGSQGNLTGQFDYPVNISVWNDQVYVVDSSNHRIQIFDLAGNFKDTSGTQGSMPGQFNRPQGIAYTNNYFYIVDGLNNRIQKFSCLLSALPPTPIPTNPPATLTPTGVPTAIKVVADFSPRPRLKKGEVVLVGKSPFEVRFVNESWTLHPEPRYEWDFGNDGKVSTEINPTHKFRLREGEATRTFKVTLKVTDIMGESATKNLRVRVTK